MPWNYILAAVFAVGMFTWLFWPWISAQFARLRAPKQQLVVVGDEEVHADVEEMKDVAALHRLKDRFVRLKCKDGQSAMAVAATHFFHEEGHA